MRDWLLGNFYVFGIPMQNWMPLSFWIVVFAVAVGVRLKKDHKH
jgi:hypothetical protein